MKILNKVSPLEQKVQQIESLMLSLGVGLAYNYDGLVIEFEGKNYPIIDLESQNDKCTSFPRFLDSERLKVSDE